MRRWCCLERRPGRMDVGLSDTRIGRSCRLLRVGSLTRADTRSCNDVRGDRRSSRARSRQQPRSPSEGADRSQRCTPGPRRSAHRSVHSSRDLPRGRDSPLRRQRAFPHRLLKPNRPPLIRPPLSRPPLSRPLLRRPPPLIRPQSHHPQSSRPQPIHPQPIHPPMLRPQSSRPQSSHPQSSRPQSSRPQSSRPQSSHLWPIRQHRPVPGWCTRPGGTTVPRARSSSTPSRSLRTPSTRSQRHTGPSNRSSLRTTRCCSRRPEPSCHTR